ncbi:Uncharacterized protein T10_19 [Trichinella papuae]|uniref:RNA-directed DNA polymerase n=1 Tax=Trichinella papuae TaxID=268474 RepID=A0A0V1MK06_9BILA|nr:Uncharacterized protein T10_19 [Trichinella papuae]
MPCLWQATFKCSNGSSKIKLTLPDKSQSKMKVLLILKGYWNLKIWKKSALSTDTTIGDECEMKDTFIGAIGPFDPKFLMVNGVPESKRAAVFFTVMGDEHFQLLTSLVIPKDPTTMSFDECVGVLTDHLQQATLEGAEDTVKSFVAQRKWLSLNCAFDTHLPSALRDQFILGLHSDVMKRRLLLQPDLTFEKAVQLAHQMEAADREMAAWRPTVEEAWCPVACHGTLGPRQRSEKGEAKAECPLRRTEIRSLDVTVVASWTIERLAAPTRTIDVDSVAALDIGKECADPAKSEMNKVPVTMELDTGASCSIIEEETWMMLRHPTLRPTFIILQVYGTGQKLRTLGSCRVEMELSGHKEKVDVFVIRALGYPCLFGRDLLEKFPMDWKAFETMATTTTEKALAIHSLSLTELKANGYGRFAADYKVRSGKSDIADWYPLPSNEDMFAALSDATVFSRLDLSDAYLQIELKETAKKCLYTMERITAGLEGVNCYLDDIIVFGSSTKEHDERLLFSLLKRLDAEGFRLKASKCAIGQHELEYLGHVVDSTVFLGWLTTMEGLFQICKSPFCRYRPCCMRTLHGRGNQLVTKHGAHCVPPSIYPDVLMHYNSELPVRLECDSCGYGIGAALSQVLSDGSHRPIAFASKEEKKSNCVIAWIIEREALALVFGVQKFHRYLFGRNFTLVTDHKPLLLVFGPKDTTSLNASRLHRWSVLLFGCEFEIAYCRLKMKCEFVYPKFGGE